MIELPARRAIQDLLESFIVAIELDQRRVDGMPAASFHQHYEDKMWRRWRRYHISYINHLLRGMDAISPVMFAELAAIAAAHEPMCIRRILIELFSEAVEGGCGPSEDLGSADLFWGRLITQAREQAKRRSPSNEVKPSILEWLAISDPLWIAKDRECQYVLPSWVDG